jgi:hypothetical protein
MSTDELHAFLDESEPPFTIHTKGGRSYWITDRTHLWAPEEETELLCVLIPRKGIFVLRVKSIESLQIEHDTTGVN